MWLIYLLLLLLLGRGQEKGETKGGDIIHHHLLRGGEGGATHVYLDATIEGKEQFYYYKHVMFLSDIELVQIL